MTNMRAEARAPTSGQDEHGHDGGDQFDPAEVAEIGRDPDLLERFYRVHYDELVRYVTRRVRDPHDVADVVAETFLASIDQAGSYDPRRGRSIAWLIGIAHHKVGRLHRARDADDRAVRRVAGRRLLDSDDIAELLDRIDAAAAGASALGLLDRLSAGQRHVVELVDIHGLTPTETGRLLGLPAGVIRIRLYRARGILRRTLENDMAAQHHRKGEHHHD